MLCSPPENKPFDSQSVASSLDADLISTDLGMDGMEYVKNIYCTQNIIHVIVYHIAE